MYRINSLDFRHVAADTLPTLPIDILYSLPDYVTTPENVEWLFNLPGAINDLMGSVGWQRAIQVFKPRIWAPNWTDEELMDFVAAPYGRNKYPFPDVDAASLRATIPPFEIVHFVGNLLMTENGTVFAQGSETGKSPDVPDSQILSDLLIGQTRLLILQNSRLGNVRFPEQYMRAATELAQKIIAGGGPPVIVMGDAGRPEVSKAYFANLYAQIVHDKPLSEAASPSGYIDGVIELFLGEGGDNILRLTPLQDQLNARVLAADDTLEALDRTAELQRANEWTRYLDQVTKSIYTTHLKSINNQMSHQQMAIRDMMNVAKQRLDFSRETGGAIPLAEGRNAMTAADDEMDRLSRAARSVDDLTSELNAAAKTAPRVLNAGFADAAKRTVLGPREALIAGRVYDFLIDIGPKWNHVPSLVTGNEVFPEFALPPDEVGYPVHVVFISSELEQQFFSTWMYVPRNTGRSFPYDPVEKKKGEKSGPIAFRFEAPPVKEKSMQLHGRLCLYYRNNLLQSARVQATVAGTADFTPELDNVVDVDFVINGKVQDLDAIATRKLKFTPKEDQVDHPVSVNLTLNDDGKHHRVLVRHLDDLPTAPPTGNSPLGWTPFDPAAARWALEKARENLKSCFFLRNEKNGQVILDNTGQPRIGLSQSSDRKQNNAKTKPQFLWDMFTLAKFGRELFDKVFGDVRPEGGWPTPADWTRSLRKTLESSSVIQVARTGPANYVFPWSLIYQYPLPGPRKLIKFCHVLNEWDASGKRNADLQKECKYRNDPGHAENVICPYGFWGLNHIIEQPIPALRKLPDGTHVLENVTDKIVMGPANLDLSVGVTHDLSPADVKNHLTRLGSITPLRLHPPDPADDTFKVRAMLNDAMVVYFLCHGEYDQVRMLPYLSIGLRDQQDTHRIYPDTLQAWADAADLKAWGTQRPLIFINGCHTTNLTPGEVLNFVTALGFAGAGGVIGTEISVLANVAIEVAESLFEKIAGNMPVTVGEAMYQTRWELANKGNLLGLAYSLYCLANLHVARN